MELVWDKEFIILIYYLFIKLIVLYLRDSLYIIHKNILGLILKYLKYLM